MTTVSIPIPDSVLHGIQKLAAKDGCTKKRAAKADLADFGRLLDRAPDVEPEAHDRL